MSRSDITGKRSGKLVAIKRLDEKKNGSYLWLCKCDCGGSKVVAARDLNGKRVTSCGCNKGFQRHLEGQRFGCLTVLSDTGKKQKNVKMWNCICDCGNTVEVRTDSLTSGRVVSCGCGKKKIKKIELLTKSRKLEEHTSEIFFNGKISKNSITGINGVTKLKNGKYIAYIGYKNKTYRLIQDDDLEIAKLVREEAEQAVKDKKFEEWLTAYRMKREK